MTCTTLANDAFGRMHARLHAGGAGPRDPGRGRRRAHRCPALKMPLGAVARALLAVAAATALLPEAAHATVSLQVTLDAPTQLQTSVTDRYTVTVNNTGSTSAGNPVMRLPLATGQVALGPLPTGCAEVTEPVQPGQSAVRQLRCTTGTVPARARRVWSFVLRAPANPVTVQHRARVTAGGSPALWSNTVPTAYANYSIPIVPGATWVISSCSNGSAGPIDQNLCPTSAEVTGEVVLAVGGVVDTVEGPIGTWIQNSPLNLIITSASGYGSGTMTLTYSVINSRCLRGPGVTTVPPQPGDPTYYSASKICRL